MKCMIHHIELSGVPKTLLLPLWGRAVVSRSKNALIDDPKAIEIAESIDFDFEEMGRHVGEILAPMFAVRAYQLDQVIPV